jgi:signal transduction histidine kinase
MTVTIRQAREEPIRQEQPASIGGISESIMHDLRNPLAAIHSAAEMLMDADLTMANSQIMRRLESDTTLDSVFATGSI